ncbi:MULTISPECIES: hypothetical protein [unclassified Sporolactobacillus]|uniref:hypothetical protein n=1 Tax=unclassified Sporolactobacillus TaxID=2628533 RepID=UPI002368044A|nr:hypothetical protein [Sporolactobacillus sp. CQH2019]MDD9150460.1 hypothetical protein [Sporolactobacillus sp. CQH2019]
MEKRLLGKLKQFFDHKENIYRVLAGVLIAAYAFLFLSRLLVHVPEDYENTALRTKINTGEITVQMTSRTFYADRNLLEIGLIIDSNANAIPTGYAVKVAEKTNVKAHYPTQLIKIVDDYYLLYIHQLPAGWTDVSVLVSDTGSSGLSLTSDNQKLYVSEPKAVKVKHFKSRSMSEHAADYYHLLIGDCEQSITKEGRKQAADRQNIHALNSQIRALKDQASYQTGSDKQTTESNISSYESQINGLQNDIQQSQTRAKDSRQEIGLLQDKLKKMNK